LLFKKHNLPYFSLHKTHWTIRPTQVLEEENTKKKYSEAMNCRHSTGDDQRLRTQYRR
ncbi:unnamed protein product, partial [Staurois parvus]